MSDSGNGLTVEKLFAELGRSYKGADLRVVLAKPTKASENTEWISVF